MNGSFLEVARATVRRAAGRVSVRHPHGHRPLLAFVTGGRFAGTVMNAVDDGYPGRVVLVVPRHSEVD